MPGVVVLGGAGFIGSHLIDELMVQGCQDVICVDNLLTGKLENIARWKNNSKFTFAKEDVDNINFIKRACQDKTTVFDFTCHTTSDVRAICSLCEVKRYIGTNVFEFKDVVYENLSSICFSLTNVYGPRHLEDKSYSNDIAKFRKSKRLGRPLEIIGNGEQRKDFIFVGDVIRACMMAMMNREVEGKFDLGLGKSYNINEVAKLVCGSDYECVNIEPCIGEEKTILPNIEPIKEQLGWQPTVSLIDGINILGKYESIHSPSGLILL